MSLESSKIFQHQRFIPTDARDLGHIRLATSNFIVKAPYALDTATESVRTLEVGKYRDNDIYAQSRFTHNDGLSAHLQLRLNEGRELLDIKTNPQIRGAWETPDGRLHDSTDIFSELSYFLPDSLESQKILDTPLPSERQIHDYIQRLVINLGVRASVLSAYDVPASILSYIPDENGLPRENSEYFADTSVTFSRALEIDPSSLSSKAYDSLRIAADIQSGEDKTITYCEYAVTTDGHTRVGIRMNGNDHHIPQYVDSVRNTDVVSDLLKRSEAAKCYLEDMLSRPSRPA